MNESNLLRCRTCYVEGKDYQSLDDHSNNYPQLTLAELLLFLTNIDIKVEYGSSKSAQHVCGVCAYQLESAYLFVRQAQDVNKRYMLSISGQEQQHQQQRADCLNEAPIDIPLENIWPIKKEQDLERQEVCEQETLATSTAVEHVLQQNKQTFDYNNELSDPITVELKWDMSEEEEQQKDDSTNKRRGRPSKQECRSKKLQNERFSCEVCNKTFAWRKDVQRHALTHFSKPEHECQICGRQFLRKDKLKDHMKVHEKQKMLAIKIKPQNNSSNNATLQNKLCKLCSSEFKSVQQLKQHLYAHEQQHTLNALQENNEVVQILTKRHGQNLDALKQVISADISQHKLLTYYSITNEFGYEMSLSDTDLDEDNANPTKYSCELCAAEFARKSAAFEHARLVHAQECLPYRCDECGMQFIARKLLQQHLSKQCHNLQKLHACVQCKCKFMWLENLQQHICKCNTQSGLQRRDCGLCGKKLKSLVKLRLHLQQHASGELPLQLTNSLYLQHNQAQFAQQPEPQIINYVLQELHLQNKLWRFYIATDKCGRELDLSDSETDESDTETNNTNQYNCTLCDFHPAVARRKYLLQHQLADHNEPLPFVCSNCQAQFVAAELLQQHIKRVCSKQTETLTTCRHCSTQFIWPINLQAHLQQCATIKNAANNGQHDSSKKLQCEYCGKEFIWAKDLTRHKRMHLPDHEKFECPYCERKFVRKDNMQAHLKVHGAEQTNSKQSQANNKKGKL